MAWQIPFANTNTTIDLTTLDNIYVGSSIQVAAVRGSGNNQKIIIDGTVAVASDAIWFTGGPSTTSGHTVTIGEGGIVRSLISSGIVFYAYNSTVENKGHIYATGVAGIAFYGINDTTTSTLKNSGVIESDSYGVTRYSNSTETVTVVNTGTISGTLFSYGQYFQTEIAKDLITNNGAMIGKIDLGLGDDLFDGRLGTVQGDVLGGGGNDRIYAGSGNNALFGGDGDDTLIGGAGADFLSGGNGSDRATYTSATKAVVVNLTSPSTNFGDAAGDTYNSIEHISGSSFNDYLSGNSAANGINGGAGDDKIQGFAGNDIFTGGAGKDVFIFSTALNPATNVDRITDFIVVDDTVYLENAVFTALTTNGTLLAASFAKNGTGNAGDASDRIIYETDTGKVYYDRDGTGLAFDSVHFATLTPGLAVTNTDFFVM